MLLDSIKNAVNKIISYIGFYCVPMSVHGKMTALFNLEAAKINERLREQRLTQYCVSRLDLSNADLCRFYNNDFYDNKDELLYDKWIMRWMYDVVILRKMLDSYNFDLSVVAPDVVKYGIVESVHCCILNSFLQDSSELRVNNDSNDWTDIVFRQVCNFVMERYQEICYVKTHCNIEFEVAWRQRCEVNLDYIQNADLKYNMFDNNNIALWKQREYRLYHEFYQQHVAQYHAPLDDKFDDRCEQFDLVSKLTTAEYEVLSDFTKDDKNDLLELGDGVFVAGVKAVCHKRLYA